MRYHIASLVAVFFALAIGILLGTVIVDKGVFVKQQQALVKRIEDNFARIREENRTLLEEVNNQKEFTDKVVPLAVKDRLVGKNVAVIATTAIDDEVVTNLTEGLKEAGATVTEIKVMAHYEITNSVIEQMRSYFPSNINAENARELMLRKMVDDLTMVSVATTSTPTTTTMVKVPYLVQLTKMGFIKTGIDFSKPTSPINGAIIIGGTENGLDPTETDLPIVLQLKAAKVRVVGTETAGCKKSYMKSYQASGIPTVDNIDQPIGIVSVVFALVGADGHYGVKKSATKLMPTASGFSVMPVNHN
ncbi:MAG TPA: copper transporter [Anaerolineae bacterium]|jgi:hypothetical protein|nr:copper transporter [Anaerolineae bacterium]